MDSSVYFWGLIGIVGLLILGNLLTQKYRKRKRIFEYEKMKPRDQQEMKVLTEAEWAKKDFQERIIHHKIHLFREEQDGKVICIKITNQKIRIGKLVEWAMSTNSFNSYMITSPGEKPEIGVETGFLFVEKLISEFEDWQQGIAEWESLWGSAFKEKGKREMTYYSLDEYLAKMNGLTEITGF